MGNKAIELLKKRKSELDSIKEHNDLIKNELPSKQEEWKTQGLDDCDIFYRSFRLYGDFIFYDEKELKDINEVLKYLSVDF